MLTRVLFTLSIPPTWRRVMTNVLVICLYDRLPGFRSPFTGRQTVTRNVVITHLRLNCNSLPSALLSVKLHLNGVSDTFVRLFDVFVVFVRWCSSLLGLFLIKFIKMSVLTSDDDE